MSVYCVPASEEALPTFYLESPATKEFYPSLTLCLRHSGLVRMPQVSLVPDRRQTLAPPLCPLYRAAISAQDQTLYPSFHCALGLKGALTLSHLHLSTHRKHVHIYPHTHTHTHTHIYITHPHVPNLFD